MWTILFKISNLKTLIYVTLYIKHFSTYLNRIPKGVTQIFFFHNFTPLLKYWSSNFFCVFKTSIFEGQDHYHSWTHHILNMIFFNCMESSSILSNSSFQMKLVAGICIDKTLIYCHMGPCLTMPTSSGHHSSGLATGKLEFLVGLLNVSSKISLGFSLILWKNPFENRILKRTKPLIIWMHLPPDSYIDSLSAQLLL